MSYDLWFWNQQEDCETAPGDIACALGEPKSVEGLIGIDMSAFTKSIIAEFPEIEQYHHPETGDLRQLILEAEDKSWAVLCGWDDNHFAVESHSAPGDILNRFIDVAWGFDCKLYDPQTGTRYEG